MEDLEKSLSHRPDLITRSQEQLTPLRESIIHKPPYISEKLGLPASCFSLLYRLTKDGNDASQATRRIADIFVIDTSTLPMLLPTSWKISLKPANRLLLA